MPWTVALAGGLWAGAWWCEANEMSALPMHAQWGRCFAGAWLLAASLSLVLDLNDWKERAWIVAVGVATAFALASNHGFNPPDAGPPRHATSLVAWVEPSFVPGHGNLEAGPSCRGPARISIAGRQELAWVSFPAPEDVLNDGWCLVRLEDVPASDPATPFDWKGYLHNLGIERQGVVVDVLPTARRPRAFARWAWSWRTWLATWPSLLMQAPALLGVFAGDKSAMSPEDIDRFRAFGLSHVLAVSGYHVGLASGLFLLLLRAQNRHVRRASVLGVVAAWSVAVACGSPHSATRAALMISTAWLALVRGKRGNVWHAWGLAACVVALWDSRAPLQLGTQLSFVATASLLFLARRGVWWRVPLRAQWATLPWTVGAFGSFPWLFWPTNVVVPIVLLPLGVLVALGTIGVSEAQEAAVALCKEAVAGLRWLSSKAVGQVDVRRLQGGAGTLCVGVAWLLLWLRLLPARRASLLQGSLLLAAAAGMVLPWGVAAWENNLDQPPLSWVEVRAKHRTGFWTDGHGVHGYAKGLDSEERLVHAVRRLGLHGPLRLDGEGGLRAKESNVWPQKRVHPPLEVWTQSWTPWASTCERCGFENRMPVSSTSTSWSALGRRSLPIRECPQWGGLR